MEESKIKLDETRDARQKDMVAKWVESGARGTLIAPTGFGKSRMGLIAIERLRSKNPNAQITIVVPRSVLKDQWEAKQIENTAVVTIQYLLANPEKLYELECDLLIIDEIHRFAADEFSRCFDIKTKKGYILGLTATFERADDKEELLKWEVPIAGEVTYQEAVANGWIEDVLEYNLAVQMTEEEQLEYERVNKWFKHLHNFFQGDFNLAMACLKGGPEVATVAHLNDTDATSVRKNAMNWFRTMNKRKNLLYSTIGKLKASKAIADALSSKKKIFFGTSVEFATKLADIIPGAVEYHSEVKSREVLVSKEKVYKTLAGVKKAQTKIEGANYTKQSDDSYLLTYPKTERWGPEKIKTYALEAIKNGKINTITSAKSLEEGLDIQDLEVAIITSRYKSVVAYKQIRGRVGRKITTIEDEDTISTKKPIVINLFHPNTADENWLYEAQRDSRNVKLFTDIEELLQEIKDPEMVLSFDDLAK